MSQTTPARHHPFLSGIRWLIKLLVLCVLLGVNVFMWLPHVLPPVLQHYGIHLSWTAPQLTWHNLQLEQLQIQQDEQRLTIDGLELNWSWAQKTIQQLHIQHLHGSLDLATLTTEDDNSTPTTQQPAYLAWLPKQLTIQKLDVNLRNMAQIQGHLTLSAAPTGHLLQPSAIELDLSVEQINDDWLAMLPPELQPERLVIRALTDSQTTPAAIQPSDHYALALDIHTEGPTHAQLTAKLRLTPGPPWSAQLEQGQLTLNAPRLQLPPLHSKRLKATLLFNAQADERGFNLTLQAPAQLRSEQLSIDNDLHAHGLELTLAQLHLQGAFLPVLRIDTSATYQATLERLEHETLHPQRWSLSGQVSGELPNLKGTTAITGQHGLHLDSDWSWLNEQLSAQIQLKDIYFRAGNPLQRTLVDWPALIEFSNGRLAANASLYSNTKQPLSLHLTGRAEGLSGIVNRSELSKLNAQGELTLTLDSLQLSLSSLQIDEFNPGVPIKQLTAQSLRYHSPLADLLSGQLRWQHLSGQLLNGRFSAGPQQLDLTQDNRILLNLDGIELQEALRVYPAEGLYGTATMDGKLPLLITAKGVFIEQGKMQARAPGILQFHSEKIRALGQSNPAMRLVSDALEDFHFNVLSSAISYEPSGKLLLNIQLEGKNPAVEHGRPIHLNLSIEEDLPALLASIQLSNHVSDTIQERIRQRLQNR